MIGAALLFVLAYQAVPPEVAQQTRDAFDPARLAAAHRLRVANGSEATLAARVEQAARAILRNASVECLELAAAAPRRHLDCSHAGEQTQQDLARLPSILPALIEEARVMEERAYATRFTADELDEIARFIASPVGRKFAAEIDPINREATTRLRLLLRYNLAAGRTASSAPALETKP